MESWDAGRHEQTRHSSMSQAFYVTGKGRESERVVSPCWLPADMTQTPPGRDVMNLKWMQSHIFTEILLPSFALFIFCPFPFQWPYCLNACPPFLLPSRISHFLLYLSSFTMIIFYSYTSGFISLREAKLDNRTSSCIFPR